MNHNSASATSARRSWRAAALVGLCLVGGALVPLAGSATTNSVAPESLTLPQSLEIAIAQNPDILRAREELRRTRGLIVDVRGPALPQVNVAGQYQRVDANSIEAFPGGGTTKIYGNQLQPWDATIEASQLVYAGGRVTAAIRAAKLVDQSAVLDLDRQVADTILQVRRSFYEILASSALVEVREQSVTLLERQLQDARSRFDAGAAPQFTVLRAEVELANARPPLIRARSAVRLAKEGLLRLLAIDSPPTHSFTSVQFLGELQQDITPRDLETSLTEALDRRPEIRIADNEVRVAEENVRVARAGYFPEAAVFAGYGWRDTTFSGELDNTIDGWAVGARLQWPLFDGLSTKGRVDQARAQLSKAAIGAADVRRSVQLEVRQAYSVYLAAVESLTAQTKTVEQAEEGLRLAEARFRAGSGTQLDVLSAQTALTDARSNKLQALFDHNVAVATLDRVSGATTRVAQ